MSEPFPKLGAFVVTFHNLVHTITWFSILVLLIIGLLRDPEGTMKQIEEKSGLAVTVYKYIQIDQCFEIIYTAIGWQKASLVALVPQTAARTFFGLFTMPQYLKHNPKHTLLVFICLAMFSMVESFRYGFYLVKKFNLEKTIIGKFFGILRYNLFLVCYPLGAACECLVLYYVAKGIGSTMNINMPNRWNFGLDFQKCLYVMMLGYGVVFP